MNENDKIRDRVSKAYASVVSRPRPSAAGPPSQKGFAAKLAGYRADELKLLPEDAVVNSFGCGNPLAFSGVVAGDVVLDLGCGAGIDLLIAAKRAGPEGKVIGIDMTDEMLAKANEVIAESGFKNIEVRKGLIEDLPVESASVDWVISNCVINLSPEKDRVFAEIARVLKPGGKMLISDIVAEDLPGKARGDLALYCSCIAGAISEEQYRSGLAAAGLVDVEVPERIEYDTRHIQGLIESDQAVYRAAQGCCGTDSDHAVLLPELAGACGGRVFSARIFARKPA